MLNRKYLPDLASLIDRLSICLLKSILIPEHKKYYLEEIALIKHDISEICKEKDIKLDADFVFSIMAIILINREIWLNESKARQGGSEQDKLLKFTHSCNGKRNKFKNIISEKIGERTDKKLDCLASEFTSQEFIKTHGDWDI